MANTLKEVQVHKQAPAPGDSAVGEQVASHDSPSGIVIDMAHRVTTEVTCQEGVESACCFVHLRLNLHLPEKVCFELSTGSYTDDLKGFHC